MNSTLILLSLSYVALAFFIVWVSFGKKFSSLHKVLISMLLPVVYYLHWTGLQQTRGWPSDQTLPTKFELISADVVEPNQAKKIKGNIHLWIRPTDNGAPRAYILPYSRDLHQRLFEARQKISQGKTQYGVLSSMDSYEGGSSIGGGMKLKFKNAPRKRLPAKSIIR